MRVYLSPEKSYHYYYHYHLIGPLDPFVAWAGFVMMLMVVIKCFIQEE